MVPNVGKIIWMAEDAANHSMKGWCHMMFNRILSLSLALVLLLGLGMAQAGEKAPQSVVDLANGSLAKLGSDPVIVAAVKAQNAKGMSLDEIKAMDEKWKGQAGVADYMKAIMESKTGQHIRQIQESQEYYAEIFVMDNQGANVAMTDKTSDYWQGDEAKFKESFAGGKGAVFVDEVEFDDSAQSYLCQVSVPVMDGGKAIGAITFGIDVDKI
jgi:hypothetical protein